MKPISHLNVTLTFAQEVIYLEDGCSPFTLTIRSNDELAQELKYKCVDWLVKSNLGKVVNAAGDPIEPGYELGYGDNTLYYQPHAGSEGQHILEVTVSDEKGTIKKKQQTAITVKDHLPINFQVELKPEKSSILVHESVKLLLDITSRQADAAQLTYQIKEISTDKGTFSATAQGTAIGPSHALSYGKNILYYNNTTKETGVHDLKLVVVSSKGDTQTVLASLNILDTDFQVKLKLEKPTIYFYEQAKLIVEITSQQPGVDQLGYHVQEASTSVKKGKFLATAEGVKMGSDHALTFGKNVLYYHPSQQLGAHDLKLVLANSNGNTKTVLASLQVLDTDFQVKIELEKSTIFSHEQVKLIVNITSPQEGVDKLAYQLKEISTSVEAGQFFTTDGAPILPGQTLKYGKNVWYYTPHQPGNHAIQLVVANSKGTTKEAKALLTANHAVFSAEVKIDKPAKASDTSWEVQLHLGSNSGLKEDKWQLVSWQIEEEGIGKLQDAAGRELVKNNVSLQSGINKFKLLLTETVELKSLPQLKLAIGQPDGKEQSLVADLSAAVLSQLERALGLLEEQHKVACQKVIAKELFAQDKLDRAIHQLKMLRSNLDIIAKSTSINRDHLENALVKVHKLLHSSSSKRGLVDQAIQAKFGRGINQIDQRSRTPLIEVIDKKDLEGLDLVLSHPDVDLKVRHTLDSKNNSVAYPVLSYAIMKGENDITIPEKLLKTGADINDRVVITRAPLAVRVNPERPHRGWHNTWHKLEKSLEEYTIVKHEWQVQHQINGQKSQGETALHVAAAAKLLAPIKLLLAHRAQVNAKNTYSQTPLHLVLDGAKAGDSRVIEVTKYLLDQGAHVNAADLNENTPLHYYYTIIKECPALYSLLEKKGADKEARNWWYGKDKGGRQINKLGIPAPFLK
jgi:ankyrin repeat protein